MFFQKNGIFKLKICKYQKFLISLYQISVSTKRVWILADEAWERGVEWEYFGEKYGSYQSRNQHIILMFGEIIHFFYLQVFDLQDRNLMKFLWGSYKLSIRFIVWLVGSWCRGKRWMVKNLLPLGRRMKSWHISREAFVKINFFVKKVLKNLLISNIFSYLCSGFVFNATNTKHQIVFVATTTNGNFLFP